MQYTPFSPPNKGGKERKNKKQSDTPFLPPNKGGKKEKRKKQSDTPFSPPAAVVTMLVDDMLSVYLFIVIQLLFNCYLIVIQLLFNAKSTQPSEVCLLYCIIQSVGVLYGLVYPNSRCWCARSRMWRKSPHTYYM